MESRISLTQCGLALLARLKLVSLTQRRVEGLPVGSAHLATKSAERARRGGANYAKVADAADLQASRRTSGQLPRLQQTCPDTRYAVVRCIFTGGATKNCYRLRHDDLARASDRLTDAHKMLKSLLVVALVAGCSASQLNQPRPAIAARSQESLALRLRGGNSVVTVAPQTNVLRGGGSKPLFMGIDVQLLSYFAFWSVPIPEAARTYPLPTPQPGYITTLGATQVPAQLLLLD